MEANSDPESSQSTWSWDSYWHGTDEIGAFTADGISHTAILGFWREFFQTLKERYEAPSVVDLASGNGAVVKQALEVFGNDPVDISSVDISDAAIASIRDQFPNVHGIVSDARRIPLQSASFDIVTSQFGVEYAGLEAVDEAIRLLAPGGHLALLLHHQDSSIHLECAAGLNGIQRVQESEFIPRAIDFFSAGFETVRGADRAPYDAAGARLNPAIQTLENIIEEHGEQVAGGAVASLYSDVRKIHQRIQHYDPQEVLEWLQRMEHQLEDYLGRMASMLDAALDGDSFARICARFDQPDCTLEKAGPLLAPDQSLPLAWALLVTA